MKFVMFRSDNTGEMLGINPEYITQWFVDSNGTLHWMCVNDPSSNRVKRGASSYDNLLAYFVDNSERYSRE